MSLPSVTEVIPLETDSSGVVRVGKTRVTLDTIVAAFCEGATAEEIVHHWGEGARIPLNESFRTHHHEPSKLVT